MSGQPQPAAASLITVAEASDRLGLSEKTVRRRIAEGQLRAYRVGPRFIRLYVEDVDAFLQPIQSDQRAGLDPDVIAQIAALNMVDGIPPG